MRMPRRWGCDGGSRRPTSAYQCQVRDNALLVTNKTTLKELCVAIDAAIEALSRGEAVTVQGAHMAELRERLRRWGILA